MLKVVKGLPYKYSSDYRLRSKSDIQSVFDAKPKKRTRKYLTTLYTPNQLPHPRLGIIIGKHNIRRAVDRNRIRRVIRESFRHEVEKLKGLDIIVMIRSNCSSLENATLRNDIGDIWQAIS